MKGNRLYKCEKLCSRTAINGLFANGHNVVAYPLRAVVMLHEEPDAPAVCPIYDNRAKEKDTHCSGAGAVAPPNSRGLPP